jgi:enoyl-CoA hydratase/carnithine racemase
MSNAAEILMSGRFVTADRALAIGLVSDVVAPEALLDTGMALARDMMMASPMGLRLTKEGLNAALAMPGLEAAMAFEDRQQVVLSETADHAEAVQAFRERRAPDWSDQ